MGRNSSAKERIDIERLLEWAYRVQCVDRQVAQFSPSGPASSSGALGQYAALGTRVDNSGFAARALGFRMPDDAMIVHDAVLALGDMWIEWTERDEVEIWDAARIEREGRALEHAGGRWLLWPRVTDAAAMRPTPLEQAAVAPLLIIHARSGSRPEWHEGWSRAPGVAPRDSGAVGRYGHRRRRRSEDVRIEDVMHARAIYLVWRAALVCLAADLDGALQRIDATGPEAPAAPWRTRRQPPRAA